MPGYSGYFTSTNVGGLKHKWIIDSGTSQHYCNNLKSFTDYSKFSKPQKTIIGDGRIVLGYGSGTVWWIAPDKSETPINNVIHTPEMQQNLLSVKEMTEKGVELTFGQKSENPIEK